jgi:hypothetical protein
MTTDTQLNLGAWKYNEQGNRVEAYDDKDRHMTICDIRGWGYLTGKGHGALGLDHDTAVAIQTAHGNLLASAPALKAENEELRNQLFDCEVAIKSYQKHTGQSLDDVLAGKWTHPNTPSLVAERDTLKAQNEELMGIREQLLLLVRNMVQWGVENDFGYPMDRALEILQKIEQNSLTEAQAQQVRG